MLESVFVDTGYVLALVNEHDQHHAQALLLSQRYERHPVIVTDAVLLEIGNAQSGRNQGQRNQGQGNQEGKPGTDHDFLEEKPGEEKPGRNQGQEKPGTDHDLLEKSEKPGTDTRDRNQGETRRNQGQTTIFWRDWRNQGQTTIFWRD
jgi:hypothetical protein